MLPTYQTLKHLHMSAAALSIALFVLRGVWTMRSPQYLALRSVRIVPHVIDTLLLASAIALAWQIGFVANASWLSAKIVALVLYVVLGTIALRRGRTPRTRTIAFVAAIATFAYIVSVAVTKSPLGALSLIG